MTIIIEAVGIAARFDVDIHRLYKGLPPELDVIEITGCPFPTCLGIIDDPKVVIPAVRMGCLLDRGESAALVINHAGFSPVEVSLRQCVFPKSQRQCGFTVRLGLPRLL